MPIPQWKESCDGEFILTVVVTKVVAVELAAETTHEQALESLEDLVQ